MKAPLYASMLDFRSKSFSTDFTLLDQRAYNKRREFLVSFASVFVSLTVRQ